VALAAPEPIGEEQPPAAAAQGGPPVQTEVTGPAAVPPVSPPVAVALLSPEPPAPASESPAVVAAAQTTTQQSSTTVTATTPAGTPARQPPAAASTPRAQGNTWYVQLAAYATEKGAQDLEAKLSTTYPTQVIAPAATGARMYRVVVGPLNKAESGTLLVWFRFRGFPDAFAKQE
jgi:cell division septation protein DedD